MPSAPKFLRIASDLHNEWSRAPVEHTTVLPPDERDASSVLILAGDIGSGRPLAKFLAEVSHRFHRVIYVPGNHEYYGGQGYDHTNQALTKLLADIPNLDFSCGTTGYAQWASWGFDIIYTTMWTDCDNGNPLAVDAIQKGMCDFRAIPNFSAVTTIRLHEKAKKEIQENLEKSYSNGRKAVVVTHHIPSHELIADKWKAPGWNEINGGFAAHCDDLLDKPWSPALWVFGHTHDKINATIGNTLCMSNPKGYPTEYTLFEPLDFIHLQDLLT